jgi:hypothetical protein
MRPGRLLLGVCWGLAILLSSTRARAEIPAWHWYMSHYELGVTASSGAVSFGGTGVSGYGIRLVEHSGFVTPVTIGAPITALLMMTVTDKEVTGIRKVYAGDDSIRTQTVTEGSVSGTQSTKEVTTRNERRLVDIQVESRPLPLAEVAKQEAERLDAVGRIFKNLLMHFDLTYFPNRNDGSLHGTRVTWYPVSVQPSRYFQLALGYNYTKLRADAVVDMQPMAEWTHRAHAVPARLIIKPALWIYASAEVRLNLLGFKDGRANEDRSSSARADLTVKIPRVVPWLHRLYVRGGFERNRLTSGGAWGTNLEAGLAF